MTTAVIAFGLAQFDQLDRVVEFALDALIAVDRVFEPGALAHHRLRGVGVVPELGVLGLRVQLVEPAVRGIPVKDASSAGRTIF